MPRAISYVVTRREVCSAAGSISPAATHAQAASARCAVSTLAASASDASPVHTPRAHSLRGKRRARPSTGASADGRANAGAPTVSSSTPAAAHSSQKWLETARRAKPECAAAARLRSLRTPTCPSAVAATSPSAVTTPTAASGLACRPKPTGAR